MPMVDVRGSLKLNAKLCVHTSGLSSGESVSVFHHILKGAGGPEKVKNYYFRAGETASYLCKRLS